MVRSYPDDADGDALQRVADQGSDMSRPMTIDFVLSTNDMSQARSIAQLVAEHGYQTDIHLNDESRSIDVYCTKRMVPTYDDVVACQAELTQLCEPFGVVCDSWGTYGNEGEQ
jgi:hypothetical protein